MMAQKPGGVGSNLARQRTTESRSGISGVHFAEPTCDFDPFLDEANQAPRG
jgi:hypothetical protein